MAKLKKGLSIGHVNCRSLCNKFDSFKFHVTELKRDIMTVSETWLNPNIPDALYALDGYNMERLDRARVSLTGGRQKKVVV